MAYACARSMVVHEHVPMPAARQDPRCSAVGSATASLPQPTATAAHPSPTLPLLSATATNIFTVGRF